LSSQRVLGRPNDYAVVWRSGAGPPSSGKLALGEHELVLQGGLAPGGFRISFDELSSVKIGREVGERINGDKSLVLERHSSDRVLLAPLGGSGCAGVLVELNELLGELCAEHMVGARVAVVVPIRTGTVEQARQLVAEGPPFNVEALGLERHHVFVSEREVIFLFEGESAAAAIDALARDPAVLKAALRWRRILGGRPRLAHEQFSWNRTS
jgi:hypothetical protein